MKHPATAIIATVFVMTAIVAQGAEVARPNILWLVSEDNTYNYVGVYGDPLARTPNIDRLAREGIVFENAHSTAPVCSPSRSSLITGIYTTSLGTQHMRGSQPLPDHVRLFPEYLRSAGYFTTNNDKTDYNSPPPYDTAWDENSSSAHWRHRAAGQPFFAVFNFLQSHEGSNHKRLALTTDPSKVRVPAYLPDTPNVRADIAQYYDSVARIDEKIGEVLKQLETDGLAGDTIVLYYADNGGILPRSKRFLFDNGTHIPMVMRVPAKYRQLAPGAPNTRSKELVNFVDFAPTVLSLAGVAAPPHMQGRAFAGTVRGKAPEFTFAIRDRMEEHFFLSRAVIDGRFRYIRNYRPDLANGRHSGFLWGSAAMRDWAQLWQEGKLNPVQRAFFERTPPEQLFDCTTDPDNVRNLAGDPAYRKLLTRLRGALREHLLSTRDTGFMPEPMMIELAAGRSPMLVAAEESVYPLAELLDFLDLTQLAPKGAGTRLEQAARHRLPVLRYWSAVVSMDSAIHPDLTTLLDDADATVRLAAADALVRFGASSSDKAWNEIAAALNPKNSRSMNLLAANAVADRSDASAAAIAALRKLPPPTIFEGENWHLYFTWLLARVDARAAEQSAEEATQPNPQKATVDDDGTVHVPAFSVPFSSLGSEEAKRNFVDFVRGFRSLADGRCGTLDDCLMKPGVERLRAAFPVKMTAEMIGGVQTDVIVPAGGVPEKNADRVLINLHGGGFSVGARFGGQMESIPIASLGAVRVITVDYREGPEHKFPAASEDVAKVYRELLKQYRADNIGIYGCSAGGMLTAQSVAWFRTHQLPRPGAIGIFGAGALVPMLGDSNYTNAPLIGWATLAEDEKGFKKIIPYFDAPNIDLKDPLISPVFHPSVLATFPPTLLVTGTRDPGLSSAAYTHARLIKVGVEADLHVWDGAAHCSFAQPVVGPNVPENREAWDVIVKFFEKHLGKAHIAVSPPSAYHAAPVT